MHIVVSQRLDSPVGKKGLNHLPIKKPLVVTVLHEKAFLNLFTLTGSDNRNVATGQGSVSLVSGSVSDRALSAPNANRGWLNMSIKPPFGVVPAMTTPGLAAAIGLLALAGAYFVRKRLS